MPQAVEQMHPKQLSMGCAVSCCRVAVSATLFQGINYKSWLHSTAWLQSTISCICMRWQKIAT